VGKCCCRCGRKYVITTQGAETCGPPDGPRHKSAVQQTDLTTASTQRLQLPFPIFSFNSNHNRQTQITFPSTLFTPHLCSHAPPPRRKTHHLRGLRSVPLGSFSPHPHITVLIHTNTATQYRPTPGSASPTRSSTAPFSTPTASPWTSSPSS
jgi:hypothetical protein